MRPFILSNLERKSAELVEAGFDKLSRLTRPLLTHGIGYLVHLGGNNHTILR